MGVEVGVEVEVECDLLLDSLQGRLDVFCLTPIQRYRHTCGSRRQR